MRIAIIFLIKGSAERYHQKLVKDVGRKFGEKELIESPLPSHITLKFPFEISNIRKVEKAILEVIKNNSKFKLKLNEFGHFANLVVYMKPQYSKKLFLIQKELMKKLRVHMKRYDKNWIPHSTISLCKNDENYKKIWKYLKSKRYEEFEADFDNISILRKYGGKDWRVYKIFNIK